MAMEAAEPSGFSSLVGRAYLALGSARRAQGELDAARGSFAASLEQLEPSLGTDHPDTREARQRAARNAN